MDSLREPGINNYDVLGLTPDASEQDVESAFEWLVRHDGFRQNLPRELWPRRLTQIESAYAALRDPEKRRAYDDSLREGPDSGAREWIIASEAPAKSIRKRRPSANGAPGSVFVGARGDAATDSLITGKRHRPRTAADAGKVAVDRNGSPDTSPAGVIAEHQSPRQTAVRQRRGRAKRESSREASAYAGTHRSRENTLAQGSNDNPFHPDRAVWLENPPWFRLVPVEHWAIGASVTLGLGALLLVSWPHQRPDPFFPDGLSVSSPTTEQIKDVAPSQPVPIPGPTDLPSDEELSPQEKAAAQGDLAAALASLRHWADANTPIESGDAAQQAPSLAPSKPAVGSAQPASQPPDPLAAAPSAPRATPPDREGPPPTPIATAPRVTMQAAAKVVAAPSTWIIGGPIAIDTRRGRYKGTVAVRFTVGLDGRLSNCTTAQSSGNSDLDALTCRTLVQRARFTPARGAQGQPMASQAVATYVWGRGQRPKK